jgi:hypothetical protein
MSGCSSHIQWVVAYSFQVSRSLDGRNLTLSNLELDHDRIVNLDELVSELDFN